MTHSQWLTEKPVFTEPCVFVTMTQYRNKPPDYKLWELFKVPGEDDEGNFGYYLALCDEYGDEYGDLADLTADRYFILPKV